MAGLARLLRIRSIINGFRWLLLSGVGAILGQDVRRKLASKLGITAHYMPALIHDLEAASKIRCEIDQVDIIDRFEIETNHDRFRANYLKKGIPVLIQDAALKEKTKDLDLNVLKERFGQHEILIRRGRYEFKRVTKTTISDYVDAILSGQTEGWYGGNNTMPPDMRSLVGDVGFVSNRFPESKGLWIGAKGSRTQLHRDFMDNLIGVLHGQKQVWLAPPHASRHLNTWEVNQTLESAGGDVSKYADRVRFVEVLLGPGDWLYLPCGWFHQILNFENVWNVSCFTYAIHAHQHWERHRMLHPDDKIQSMFGKEITKRMIHEHDAGQLGR